MHVLNYRLIGQDHNNYDSHQTDWRSYIHRSSFAFVNYAMGQTPTGSSIWCCSLVMPVTVWRNPMSDIWHPLWLIQHRWGRGWQLFHRDSLYIHGRCIFKTSYINMLNYSSNAWLIRHSTSKESDWNQIIVQRTPCVLFRQSEFEVACWSIYLRNEYPYSSRSNLPCSIPGTPQTSIHTRNTTVLTSIVWDAFKPLPDSRSFDRGRYWCIPNLLYNDTALLNQDKKTKPKLTKAARVTRKIASTCSEPRRLRRNHTYPKLTWHRLLLRKQQNCIRSSRTSWVQLQKNAGYTVATCIFWCSLRK